MSIAALLTLGGSLDKKIESWVTLGVNQRMRCILAEHPRLRCITGLVQTPPWWGKFQILLLPYLGEGWSQLLLEAVAETCEITNLIQGTGIFCTLSMYKISYHLVGKTPFSNKWQTGIKVIKKMKMITDEMCSCRSGSGLSRRGRALNKGTEMGVYKECSENHAVAWEGQQEKLIGARTWRVFPFRLKDLDFIE